MKCRIAIIVIFLSLLVTGCTSSIVPTTLTAPPSTQPPSTEDTGPTLSDVGILCDIAEYGDGYLLLTHTGLYTTDANFRNLKSAGEEWEKLFNPELKDAGERLFDEHEEFFLRLKLYQNYDEPLFKNLTVTSKGIFFCTTSEGDSYLNGKPWALSLNASNGSQTSEEVPAIQVADYAGSTYALCGTKLFKNGEPITTLHYSYWADSTFLWLQGKLYVHITRAYTDETVNGFYAVGEDGSMVKAFEDLDWRLTVLSTASDGNYAYLLINEMTDEEDPHTGERIYIRRLMRTDGTWVEKRDPESGELIYEGLNYEFLDCPPLLRDDIRVLRMIPKGSNTILFLTEAGNIQTVSFTPLGYGYGDKLPEETAQES